MQTLQFSILIHADKKQVWDIMLDKQTYQQWTKEFGAGSYYEGDWDKGSEIRFLAQDEHGQLQGMFSRIKENIPYEYISIEHIGMVANGIVDTTSDDVKKWVPSYENYSFADKDGKTELSVDVQVESEYLSMFSEMWPKALHALKALCEEK